MRVVVLGAGFGGLELSTRLSEEFGDAIDVVLIDKSDGFVFGFSKLDVMFGRATPPQAFATHTAMSSSQASVRPDGGPVDRPERQAGRDRRRDVRRRRARGGARCRP